MEVTSSFGITEQTILFIEAVIEENFSDRFDTDSLNKIQEIIQGYLGGYWGIQFYEDPYMFYSTSIKRSPSFVIFDVSGSGIAVIKGS
uniref:Peptidase S41 n=1 Tax=Caenorhabditis tropicalis TaxID=1561998 RepID=A0A1I7UCQ6_9PELO